MFAALINNLNHNFMKKSMFILGAALILGALSCSKGDTGPAGTAGPTGAQGNANVNSQQFTVTSWNGSGPVFQSQGFSDGNITTNGQVSAYLLSNTNNWVPLPCSDYLVNGDNMAFIFQAGTISFVYYSTAGAPSGTYTFNVVTVPPAMIKQHPNTNFGNAAEVELLPEVQTALKSN